MGVLLDDAGIEKMLTIAKVHTAVQIGDEYIAVRNPFALQLRPQKGGLFQMDNPLTKKYFLDDKNPFFIGKKLAPFAHNYDYGIDLLKAFKDGRDRFEGKKGDKPALQKLLNKMNEQASILERMTRQQLAQEVPFKTMSLNMWDELAKEEGFDLDAFRVLCLNKGLTTKIDLNSVWASLYIDSFIPLLSQDSGFEIWLALLPATWAQLGWKRTLLLAVSSVLVTEGTSAIYRSYGGELSGHSICTAMFAGQELWTGIANRNTLNPWTRWLAPVPGLYVTGNNIKSYWLGILPGYSDAMHFLGFDLGLLFGYTMNHTNFLK